MRKMNLLALVVALTATCANPGYSSSEALDPAGVLPAHVTKSGPVAPPEGAERVVPVTTDQMLAWFEEIAPGYTFSFARKKPPHLDFRKALEILKKNYDHWSIPIESTFRFGRSFPYAKDSQILNVMWNKLKEKRPSALNVLNLGAGHGFFELELFIKAFQSQHATITCHSMELTHKLVTLFTTHTKPLLASIDADKARKFMMLQGDVRDSSHALFQTSTKRDVVTAFNLFHYLNIEDWAVALANMHGALKEDGFAVFVMQGPNPEYDAARAKMLKETKESLDTRPEDMELREDLTRKLHDDRFPFKFQLTHLFEDLERVKKTSLLPSNAPVGTIIEETTSSHTFVAPLHFNDKQALHCVEYRGLFKAQSIGGIQADGTYTATPGQEDFIFVIASPVFKAEAAARGSGTTAGNSTAGGAASED